MCQAHRKAPPEAPLHPWVNTERPMAWLHMDFAGPFRGRWFLVLVDAFSKGLEVHPTNAATVRATVKILQCMLATHGLPSLIVTDNGSVSTRICRAYEEKRDHTRDIRSVPPRLERLGGMNSSDF